MKTELQEIVGSGNVLDIEDMTSAYSKDQSFAHPMKPWMVVRPGNASEIQALVKWANQTKTPLIPVSSGPPRFHGDTVPSAPGSVIVDMSRMNKIIRIDPRNRMAIVEAGVTYNQLQSALAKEKLSICTPLLPRRNKSVIASLLEREPITAPRYQTTLIEPLRCLEIIWGSGEKLVTGEAGSRVHSLEKQWEMNWVQMNPWGPGQTDYYRIVSAAQGSMGIITWASLKCDRLPVKHKLFFIPSDDISKLIDCGYKLSRVRIGEELFLLNSTDLAYIQGKGSTINQFKKGLPAWVLVIGVVGRNVLPDEKVQVEEKAIADITGQCGLKIKSALSGVTADELLKTITTPSEDPVWKLKYKGGCQDIMFLTTLNRVEEFIGVLSSIAEDLDYPTADIGTYIQPVHQGVGCHCEFSLTYDPNNSQEVAKVEKLYINVSKELLNRGAFFSRPYGIWADMVYNRDAQSTALLKQIKGIFDPNNVMNPGKLCF